MKLGGIQFFCLILHSLDLVYIWGFIGFKIGILTAKTGKINYIAQYNTVFSGEVVYHFKDVCRSATRANDAMILIVGGNLMPFNLKNEAFEQRGYGTMVFAVLFKQPILLTGD